LYTQAYRCNIIDKSSYTPLPRIGLDLCASTEDHPQGLVFCVFLCNHDEAQYKPLIGRLYTTSIIALIVCLNVKLERKYRATKTAGQSQLRLKGDMPIASLCR